MLYHELNLCMYSTQNYRYRMTSENHVGCSEFPSHLSVSSEDKLWFFGSLIWGNAHSQESPVQKTCHAAHIFFTVKRGQPLELCVPPRPVKDYKSHVRMGGTRTLKNLSAECRDSSGVSGSISLRSEHFNVSLQGLLYGSQICLLQLELTWICILHAY